ncbi:YoaK family small membrane protein [Klebsiella pneumoniae]|nr:YoaK family small membrane protein [Klebsiella pneumoniae]MBG1977234.1 YoaK family small membrane protein [Klebsiella pneumoniae]MBG2009196.1 YoaK family small membrane protein [Klebsiella pneumoniae]MBG2434579.1 YoaK family small membrane protein [Klebsiella pneumoniae]UNG25683.1 YoaK family small membrane protein [Klebsiella pneumoniae]WKV44765.1 YoaK family small membrane protein [Klebsiella pneumoniae]
MKIGIVFLVVVFIVAVAFLTWFVFGGYVTTGG